MIKHHYGVSDPALGHVCALDSDPLELHLARSSAVPAGRLFLPRLHEAHSQPLGSFDVVLSVVDAVCRREDVSVPHQRPRASGGQLDGGGEGVVHEEVLAHDTEAAVWTEDLPSVSGAARGRRVEGVGVESVDAHRRLCQLSAGVQRFVGQELTQGPVAGSRGPLVALGAAGRVELQLSRS